MSNFRPILAAEGLTEQQWRVLRALADADKPMSVNQLAERALLLGPSLSRILTGLEARGVLDRTKAPEDARRAVIAINGGGRALGGRTTIGAKPSDITRHDLIKV